MGPRKLLHEHQVVHRWDLLLEQRRLAQRQSQDGVHLKEYTYDPQKESLCQGLTVDSYKAGAANSSLKNNLQIKTLYCHEWNKIIPFLNKIYLWLIRVRKREAFREGKANFSLKSGFASISFFSSISIMLRADLVSPYFDNCSFSL